MAVARFWGYAVDPRPYKGPGYPAVFYRCSADRKGKRPRGDLDGFSGYLHADAFGGLRGALSSEWTAPAAGHPCCLHGAGRCKLFEVFETTKSPIAEEALRRIQELYAIEANIKAITADQRRPKRRARSKSLLDALVHE